MTACLEFSWFPRFGALGEMNVVTQQGRLFNKVWRLEEVVSFLACA